MSRQSHLESKVLNFELYLLCVREERKIGVHGWHGMNVEAENNFVELGFSYHGGGLGVTLKSSGLLSKLHYSLDHLASLGKYFYMTKDETLSK